MWGASRVQIAFCRGRRPVGPIVNLLMLLYGVWGCSEPAQAPATPPVDAQPLAPVSQSVPEGQTTPSPRSQIGPQTAEKQPAVDFSKLSSDPPRQKVEWAQFVGAQACASCHPEEYDAWGGSTHGQAGGWPNDETIIPKFDGEVLKFTNARVRLSRDGSSYAFLVTRGKGMERRYTVDGVVGRGLIHGGGAQTFFTRGQHGRMLFLPLEYNVEKKSWFCQTTTPKKWAIIDGSFPLEACQWPAKRPLGTGTGPTCQNCHGSQIEVAFTGPESQIETRVKSFSINCESCHGPGKRHVTLMAAGGAPKDGEIGMRALSVVDKHESMKVCMACHGNKLELQAGYLSGDPLENYYAQLTLWDVGERKVDFDGRTLGFAYQQGHVYSPCYTSGSMTCVDCHSPHSLKYRDVTGTPLVDRFDDGQCVGCHVSKVESQAHHRHKTRLKCTDCHMPFRQHDNVGTQIRISRSDHAIPIPRPGSTHGEQACRDCHLKVGVPWETSQFSVKFGGLKPRSALVRGLYAYSSYIGPTGRPRGDKKARAMIDHVVAALDRNSPIVSILAMSYFLGELLQSEAPITPAVKQGLWRATESRDIDVAGSALATLLFLTNEDEIERRKIFDYLVARPETRESLRLRLVFNLIGLDHAYSRVSPDAREQIREVMETDGLAFGTVLHALQPAISMSYLDDNEYAKAIEMLGATLDLAYWKQNRIPVTVLGGRDRMLELLAMAHAEQGYAVTAIETLEGLVKAYPHAVAGRHQLCQLYQRRGQLKKCLDCLDDLMQVDPEYTNGLFLQAQVLQSLGRYGEALQKVEEGLKYSPGLVPAMQLKTRLRQRLGRGP